MAVDIIARGLAGRADSKAITAYEYAKRAGYTGTEEEFAEDMGNSATNATNARESAEQAQEYAEQAEQTLENKADIDGSYEDLTAGSAEQLLSDKYLEDNTAYNFRRTADGKAVGDREIDEIIGGTLVINQLLDHENAVLRSEASYDSTTHRFTIDIPENAAANNYVRFPDLPLVVGHKYFLRFKVVAISEGASFRCYFPFSSSATTVTSVVNDRVFEYQEGFYNYLYVGKTSAITQAQSITFEVTLVDITQMFCSSTIANYVYSIETTTTGSGVAWLYEYFPILNGGYIPHNTGTLQSIVVSKHILTGFNQWNEKWEVGGIDINGNNSVSSTTIRSINYIRVKPDTQYYFNTPTNMTLRYYDSNKSYIGYADKNGVSDISANSKIRTTPVNCYYIRFQLYPAYGITYNNNICINISSERNGDYEPFNGHEYTLDSSKELRGILKIDSNGKLYFVGDKYSEDTVTINRGKITFNGTESGWTTYGGGQRYTISISDKKVSPNVATIENILCDKLLAVAKGSVDQQDLVISGGDPGQKFIIVHINSTIETVDMLKSWLANNPITIEYDLETPTIETATPVPNPQICSPDGTEEYIDPRVEAGTIPFAIPTGHNTKYLQNLRQKLDDLPFAPSEYGDYLVRVSADGIAFIPFANGTQVPAIPTTDGTYDLAANVSNGTATLSWVLRS